MESIVRPLEAANQSAPASHGEPQVGGIDIHWLFISSRLRISQWTCQSSEVGWSEPRSQPWHVLGFLHHGAFLFEVGGYASVMDPTSVMLLNPGQIYRTSHPFGCGDHGSAIVIDPELLTTIISRCRPEISPDDGLAEPSFPTHLVASSARGYLLQRVLFERLRRFGQGSLEIGGIALELIEESIRSSFLQRETRQRRPSTERDHRDRAEAAKALLVERYREPLRLEDIAGELAVSPFHLSRLFKRETGVPIHRYLNRLRLRDALERVTLGCHDLTNLALDLGFSSHSHFTASFSREYGIPPSALHTAATSGNLRDLLSPDRGHRRMPKPPSLTAAANRGLVSKRPAAV
jgi:AraC family transcriptional regulator